MSSVDTAAVSVAEYATRISIALRDVGGALVEGEVQRPSRTDRGMLFFELTDGDARLSCKVFPRDVRRLEHEPRHGDLVQVAIDRPDFFARQGRVSVIVSSVRLAGEGELLRRREELLRRLRADGLCDPAGWKPLPRFPRAVGLVAGHASDGLSDVVRALSDRWPPVHVVTCTARVQGAEAPGELIDSLARLQDHPAVDVIVLARGGGSVQDLVAFDDERVCRAVHACAVPVVSAVGHTDNVPVCNHVSHHAPTPSRAPELVVPDVREVRATLDQAESRLAQAARRVDLCLERAAALRARLDVRRVLDHYAERVTTAAQRAGHTGSQALADYRHALTRHAGALATVPARMPRVETVHSVAAALDARADVFFTSRALSLQSAGDQLSGVAARLELRSAEIDEQSRRVAVGTRRQLDDHERDYGRALTRLGRESRRAVDVSLRRRGELVGGLAPTIRERAQRALSAADRSLRHVVDVIGARDFRRRGWVLASDARGRPVAGAAAVRDRQRLRLRFHDGDVGAVAHSIELREDES